jgi:hypothetical protein
MAVNPARNGPEVGIEAEAEDESGLELPAEPRGIGSAPLAVSLLPFALLITLYFVVPAYGNLVFRSRPEIFGFPLGMAVLFIGLVWGALGVYVVSEAETFGEATAGFLTCSLPASAMVALAPLLPVGVA